MLDKSDTWSIFLDILLSFSYIQLVPKQVLITLLTMVAAPTAYAVAMYSHSVKEPIQAFVIRKEHKEHGLRLATEGNVKTGDQVMVVNDFFPSNLSYG